jgi:hypothetical protein
MAENPKPSFSPYRKWGIGFNVALIILVVFAVVVMANYLSHDYFARLHLSKLTRNELSPRTLSVLRSITNTVKVTIYYDKDDPLYTTVADLLNEYRLANPRIQVESVDYLRDAAAAQKVRSDYSLTTPSDKDLVIFDCQGRPRIVDGKALAQVTLEQLPGTTDREYRRKPTAFLGETAFTAALLHVTQPKPLRACFLQDYSKHRIDSADPLTGYVKFAGLLLQNYIEPLPISILGTNEIPADCNMLVIAAPTSVIGAEELEKIQRHLDAGKHLLVLLNAEGLGRDTGIERLLARWGVEAGTDWIVDPEHTSSGSDVIVSGFSRHPMVNPLLNSGLYMIRPRPVSRMRSSGPLADAPKVEEVAFTGPKAHLSHSPSAGPRQFAVVAAAEKGGLKGVLAENHAARIVVVGDSYFLANNQLDLLGNRDFASAMINWILERTQLLEGLGPRPVTEYRLVMTASQLRSARFLLLAGMPGVVLLLGALVHWRRNK